MRAHRPSLTAVPALVVALLACSALAIQDPDPAPELLPTPPGAIVLCADGPVPAEALIEALAQTGKEGPRVAVNLTAEQAVDPAALAAWRDLGVTDLLPLDPATPELAKQHIASADLIWLANAEDEDAFAELWRSKLLEQVAERRQEGAVVGGVGILAEALGAIFLPLPPDPAPLVRGGSARRRGMGLWSSGIVEASFGTTGAIDQMMTAILERPRITGVALGPGCSIAITEELRVLTGHAWVVDPRGAEIEPVEMGEPQSGRNLKLHVLRAGDTFEASAR